MDAASNRGSASCSGVASKRSDNPPRFAGDQHPRSYIPTLGTDRPIGVQLSGCDVAEVQCRRTEPPHGLAQSHNVQETTDFLGVTGDIGRETRSDQRLVQFPTGTHMQGLTIELCTALLS